MAEHLGGILATAERSMRVHMPRRKSLEGQRFGRLVVERWDPSAKRDGAWVCRCDCGGHHVASSNHLISGRVLSCGCLRPKHGGAGTRAYRIWQGVINRCTRENHRNWADYGGRGITICDRWRGSFPNFLTDMGEPPPGATIERIDNDRGYEPGNCRWATRKEQARNTRRTVDVTYDGRTQSLAAWAEEFGCNYWRIHTRIVKLGWSAERAFSDLV